MDETLEDVAGREDETIDEDFVPLGTLDVALEEEEEEEEEEEDALVEDMALLALELRALLVREELDDGREEKTGEP